MKLEGGEKKPKLGHGVAFVRQPRLFKSCSATESVSQPVGQLPMMQITMKKLVSTSGKLIVYDVLYIRLYNFPQHSSTYKK